MIELKAPSLRKTKANILGMLFYTAIFVFITWVFFPSREANIDALVLLWCLYLLLLVTISINWYNIGKLARYVKVSDGYFYIELQNKRKLKFHADEIDKAVFKYRTGCDVLFLKSDNRTLLKATSHLSNFNDLIDHVIAMGIPVPRKTPKRIKREYFIWVIVFAVINAFAISIAFYLKVVRPFYLVILSVFIFLPLAYLVWLIARSNGRNQKSI